MTKEKIVKLTTFGPNRNLSLQIGNYNFVDGICEVPEADSASATSVLCRYYDVCFEHELADKIKEYDAIYSNGAANVGDDPVINKANEEVLKRNAPKKVAAEKAEPAEKAETTERTESSAEKNSNDFSTKDPSVKSEKNGN